ncbi:SDR family NAD(P)-dependent oxidoreductase [Williamsia maris]|uniref:NAD(P)-dependent dehydrogenase, short-chain alcohol dehydrogenase family n=1 Tax=Williamsia maris TaxID=72806 RepID=A0ABT1HJI7_9NOCA|nr:SDR family oxidoreductase [Williamsia maris]MCP2178092.1 NAD(P)-dependent dehydrogenase, short-chain alcohol dehydrogenase family [Williamsia maris]
MTGDNSDSAEAFEGKGAIVVGGGARDGNGVVGIGQAVAILLARAGVNVLVVDHQESHAQRTVDLISDEGGAPAEAFECDAADLDQSVTAVRKAVETFGRIDLLVNNVGVNRGPADVVGIDPDVWHETFTTNVDSIFNFSRLAVTEMRQHGAGGAIVNVSSVAGIRPAQKSVAYATSKGAAITLTKAMANDHGRDGIRVNCVTPGAIYTPRMEATMSEQLRGQRSHASLLDREGTAWDVAHAVTFLLSDHARYITGHNLVVDGGLTLTSATVK